jgi:hypothetical protein
LARVLEQMALWPEQARAFSRRRRQADAEQQAQREPQVLQWPEQRQPWGAESEQWPVQQPPDAARQRERHPQQVRRAKSVI